MSVILWKIIIVSIILVETMIGAFLGWRVLELMKRVKLLQEHRNELLEERAKQSNKLRLKGIEMDEEKKEMCSDILFRTTKKGKKVMGELLSDVEKTMILNALKMPEYKSWIELPRTHRNIRVTYKTLKEKIKESFD